MFSVSQILATSSLLAASAYGQSLTSALSGNTNLTGLTALLAAQPDLTTMLGGLTNITILAPSNGAIQSLMASNSSSSDPSRIAALLQYHVLNGSYPSTAFTSNSTFIRTALTDSAYTTVTGGQRVEGLMANGKVTLISGNLYNSTVSTADIKFDGGVIHIIDRVLVLPQKLSARPSLMNAGTTVSALYNLLQTTDLLSTISDAADVTIFAPSDKGLSNVAGQLSSLSGTDAENVAKYHVVQNQGSSPYYTPRFNQGGNTTLTTLSGGNLTVTSVRGNNSVNLYYVNGARIVATNWLVGGGVLHIIDNVLSPSNRSTFINTPTIAADSAPLTGGSSSASGSGSTGSGSGQKSAAVAVAGKGSSVVAALIAVAAVACAL